MWENEDDCRRALADTDKTSHFESVARIAHEVNRAYCQSIGDDSQPAWEDAPEWQRESAINGVAFHLKNDATPEQSHANWLEQKAREGWKYGPVKDVEKKEHPCFCSYGELPAEQRAKDYLFRGVVNSFK
ncbi:RyR domain-containing protein [Klebsiella pneumoniae]|uniref:RyR domain-containing protein n=1 Tax=Klebsiella pneumoniae TaxID=573 RepID=UPI001CDAA57E|nr:RyR domain-containing protein [Klebsiella pneumoniae]MDN3943576.1 RyR domain-containing protein [Klebsiella pneumoniae]MDN3951700.1 RyR domain-containing protein [Klebsiella pneumoniae]MDN3957575.1 RyR domain-containing protein [Klebsiella pneumoniae]MDN3976062.1 RyR domain-containing protein [Klebsiella pneumoniae]MDN3978395.1 RyR domain-containing protein [Klebsiella pneumoniae]